MLDLARWRGLLDSGTSAHLFVRITPALPAAAKHATGIGSPTDLAAFASASLVTLDLVREQMRAACGALGPEHALALSSGQRFAGSGPGVLGAADTEPVGLTRGTGRAAPLSTAEPGGRPPLPRAAASRHRRTWT